MDRGRGLPESRSGRNARACWPTGRSSTLRGSIDHGTAGLQPWCDKEAHGSPDDYQSIARRFTPMHEPPHVKLLLEIELAALRVQMTHQTEVPHTNVAATDLLDAAQTVEHQEFVALSISRLARRATDVRSALERLREGNYGLCEGCGTRVARVSGRPPSCTPTASVVGTPALLVPASGRSWMSTPMRASPRSRYACQLRSSRGASS
jgi:RNA polymerase-binding transcription factor DksA